MTPWMHNVLLIVVTGLLVLVNGFFVAAEFALVKLRRGQLNELVQEGRPFAKTARWLYLRMDRALSACQLGITMASLGLGWIGEPALARLLEPVFHWMHIESSAVIHTVSFIIAFTAITAAHLVIGEQAPKIFAIRRPEHMALWCALPLKWFYVIAYPLLTALDKATAFLLKYAGVDGASEHDTPYSEEEIRSLLSHAHAQGALTRSEHNLLHAIFEFDDTVCRQIMVPRVDVRFIDVGRSTSDALHFAGTGRFTRYPVCDGSMDKLLGFVHVKDLVGVKPDPAGMRSVIRPPRFVPETMRISRLLAHFQASHEHLAFVIDEHGTVVGIVTLEDVLEQIVGPVQDEFDAESPDIERGEDGQYTVQGGALIDVVNRTLNLDLAGREVDTMAGLLMERLGRVPEAGDRVDLHGAVAQVLEVKNARATRIGLTPTSPADEVNPGPDQ